MAVLTSHATASEGIVNLRVSCRLSTPCKGALLIFPSNWRATQTADTYPMSNWLAGSDIAVGAESTTSVPIGLTPLGERLIQTNGSYGGYVFVLLKGYGYGEHDDSSGNGPALVISR